MVQSEATGGNEEKIGKNSLGIIKYPKTSLSLS
jgi:hypothetical protein